VTTLTEQKADLSLLGGRFIKAFHHMIHTVKIHQDNNQLIKESVKYFAKALAEISGGMDLEIMLWRGRFFIQGEKLPYRRESFALINEMLEYFPQRGLQGLLFHPTFKQSSLKDFIGFARLLNESAGRDDPPTWLEKQLEANEIQWVEIRREMDEIPPEIELQRKEKARQSYMHAIVAVKEVAEKVSQQSVAGIRKARRLAQTMVDLVLEDESLMLGLTTIRDYDDYTYTHSVNVALLAMALGKRIGLSLILLEQLGICGMFHDLGKVEVPSEILHKPDMLNTGEWDQMRKHPLIGVHRVLRLHATSDMKARVALGPFEHHINYNLTGYPRTHFVNKVTLFGKILRIADTYDALTSERKYRPRAFSPDEALKLMWNKVGEEYDPILLKTFVNMVGLYPVGTILKLDSGELCLVVDYPNEDDKSRPEVLLLEDDGQGNLKATRKVNLMERDQKTGSFLRNVLECHHPSKLGLQPSQFYLQEAS
jgi:HD-GYP domain-containing protein (c-di-GMP phosphodiesterase class II)